MNARIILISLLLITAWGCRRTTPTPEPYYEPDYGDLKYIIQGVKDVSLERTGTTQYNVYINRTEGRIEDVSLTALGMPAGMNVSFSPPQSNPSFNSTLTVKTLRVKEGVYTITIRGVSKTSGFTEMKMNVTVLPYSNAATGLIGLFKEDGLCTPSGAVGDTVDVTASEAAENRINIKGFWSGVWSQLVYANLNSTNKTLDIPSQSINGVTISGSGTYDDNVMIIGYRVKGLTVNDTCMSTFSRTQ